MSEYATKARVMRWLHCLFCCCLRHMVDGDENVWCDWCGAGWNKKTGKRADQ